MYKFKVLSAALLFVLVGAAYADDDSSTKEPEKGWEKYDRVKYHARGEGRYGDAVPEPYDRDQAIGGVIDKVMDPKEENKDD